MQFSDLHIHSKYSDGALWPKQIVELAEEKGLKYISVTDHDTVDSQFELNNYTNNKIGLISGVELSTEYKEKEVHILGYFIDIHDINLNMALNKVKISRIERAKRIVDKLNQLGICIELDEVIKDGSSIGRPHIAKLLVSKGYSTNTKEAFKQYLVKGKPAYVDRYKLNYKEALKLISDAKGIAVLAHPGEIYKGLSLDKIIKEFKIYGLKGIEVFHPSHSSKQINDYYNLAKKYSLVITGGSDCHGTVVNDNLLLGTVGMDEKLTNKLLKFKIK